MPDSVWRVSWGVRTSNLRKSNDLKWPPGVPAHQDVQVLRFDESNEADFRGELPEIGGVIIGGKFQRREVSMRVSLRALRRQRVFGATAVLLGVSAALLFGGGTQVKAASPSVEPLRSYADKMHFWLGAQLQGLFMGNAKYKELIHTQFNSGVSMELLGQTQPTPQGYDFHIMDHQVEFARQYDMKLFGVNLVYRPHIGPEWFETTCKSWSKEKMDSFLKDRVYALVRRGGDNYYGWEVVNEPLVGGHNGCWHTVLGEFDYIAKAFRYAREAGPNTQLVLNDSFGHDGVDKEKATQFFGIIKQMKDEKVPIDVAGIQMHLRPDNLHSTYVDEFKWFLAQAKQLGVQVQVTEMDVKLPPNGGPDILQKQKEMFYNILHTCLKDPNCTGFTFWEPFDSIRRRYPNDPPQADYDLQRPGIFDANFQSKPAYDGILQALKEGR
jgi:endo-1,4-beta-xylanase